jgi:hypothetical protein
MIDGDLETGHLTARYAANDHTPVMISVSAYEPYGFVGKYQIYDLPNKIKELLNRKCTEAIVRRGPGRGRGPRRRLWPRR